MPGIVHRDVTARGVRLRVVEEGDGPRVVLLHGLFADHRTWNGVRDKLKDSCRVIAPDLPGFGQSEILRPVASRTTSTRSPRRSPTCTPASSSDARRSSATASVRPSR